MWRGIIEEFRPYLPVSDTTPTVTLLEGNTPLIPAHELSNRLQAEIYLKVEGANPTGSFKDRGMTVALSVALGQGAKAVLCASTGNTSASAAAYAARAGISCVVLVPSGKIAAGKLAQSLVHGAQLIQIEGGFDDCLRIARELSADHPIVLVNSVNPDRIAGQKTAAFEIVRALGDAPDVHCLPVGNAGNITAYWQGYTEVPALGWASRKPKMWGFQAAGAAPFVAGKPVTNPATIASAIRIGHPASWDRAITAREESGGAIRAVSDEQILAAQALLATTEGIFVEPASAASIAGLLSAAEAGQLSGQQIVCTVTGHGLKDPQTAIKTLPAPIVLPAKADRVAKAIGL